MIPKSIEYSKNTKEGLTLDFICMISRSISIIGFIFWLRKFFFLCSSSSFYFILDIINLMLLSI